METKEIMHFTDAPEIQHFTMEKVSKNDNTYGVTWGNLVCKYLSTAYSGENAEAEVVSFGITYKVLKQNKVTVFYDVAGNTLFDVENVRLKREYGCLIDTPSEPGEEISDSDPIASMGKTIMSIFIARKPKSQINTYLKYGFVITEIESYYCPECGHILNAGPQYQPKCCDQCGQRIDFNGVKWKEDKTLGYLPMEQRKEVY